MITCPIPSNLSKETSLQCYRFYNFPPFRSSRWRCSVRRGVLRNFAKFTGKHLWQSLFFSKVAGWGDCFWSFPYLLLKISWLFHFNRKRNKWNEKREIPWWRSSFAWVSIYLTSKISKEIWQMVIWSENVFKENFMLLCSLLQEFL